MMVVAMIVPAQDRERFKKLFHVGTIDKKVTREQSVTVDKIWLSRTGRSCQDRLARVASMSSILALFDDNLLT
jgi:hypothetical protein